MICIATNTKDVLNSSKPSFTTKKYKLNCYRPSYLTSPHLQQLLKSSSYDFINQYSSISSNLIKPPTMLYTSLKDDHNISPVDHPADHPTILQISKTTSTFGEIYFPNKVILHGYCIKIQKVLVSRTIFMT